MEKVTLLRFKNLAKYRPENNFVGLSK